jgi:hypothetical protein
MSSSGICCRLVSGGSPATSHLQNWTFAFDTWTLHVAGEGVQLDSPWHFWGCQWLCTRLKALHALLPCGMRFTLGPSDALTGVMHDSLSISYSLSISHISLWELGQIWI